MTGHRGYAVNAPKPKKDVSSRHFVFCLFGVLCVAGTAVTMPCAVAEQCQKRPVVGAIRWDAWNEFDEGGWLCPSLSEGSARLDALRAVLRPR